MLTPSKVPVRLEARARTKKLFAASVVRLKPSFYPSSELSHSLTSQDSYDAGSSTSVYSRSSVDPGYYSRAESASSYSRASTSNSRAIDELPSKKRVRRLSPPNDEEDVRPPRSSIYELLDNKSAAEVPSAVPAFSEAEILALRVLAKQADARASQFLKYACSKCTPTPGPGLIEAVEYISPVSCKQSCVHTPSSSQVQHQRKVQTPFEGSEADSDDDDTSDDERDQSHHQQDALDQYIKKLFFFRLLNSDAKSPTTQLLADSSSESAGSSTFSNNATPSASITPQSGRLNNSPPERGLRSLNESGNHIDIGVGGDESILKQSSSPLPLVCWHAAIGISCKLRTGRNSDARRLFE